MAESNTLNERLKTLRATLSSPQFLRREGLGNELSFHIFDYEPAEEPTVQAYLPRLKDNLKTLDPAVTPLEVNLYHLILETLQNRNYLERAAELEGRQGGAALRAALRSLIRPDVLAKAIAAKLSEPHDLVLLTGVGAAFPLVRSHTVLNNLHAVVDRVPLVMFFPGSYSGHDLQLFGLLKDDNYYRAFPLVPRPTFSQGAS